MLPFLIAAFAIVGTPGPATLSAAGVAKGYGFWAGMRYQAGLLTGGSATHPLIWLVISGGVFTTLQVAAPGLLAPTQLVLGLIAICLLLYVAWKIGSASGELRVESAKSAPGFVQGLMLNLVNPKVYVGMYPLYYSMDLGWQSTPTEFAFKFFAILFFAFISHTVWVWIGASLGGISMSARASRIMNICFGLALAAVGLWAAYVMLKDAV